MSIILRLRFPRWPIGPIGLVVLIAGSGGLTSQNRVQADSNYAVLLASPFEGHSGNVVHLSGSGFTPSTRLYLSWVCPRWDIPSAAQLHNFGQAVGPVTDASGNFAGFPLHDVSLHGLSRSPCQFYANYVNGLVAPLIPALYTIVPHGERLSSYATRIIGSAAVVQRANRSHRQDIVRIRTRGHTWGGAMAAVTIRFQNATIRRKVPLDWEGQAAFPITVPSGSSQAGKARVHVHFHLGSFGGTTNAFFISR
ncbi:MAG: hypothetical protein ACRDFX_03690 [Chloroflexota bacterium]